MIKNARKNKKIFLLGWYGQGAHGDDLMEITTKKLFEDVARQKKLNLEWMADKKADLIIVGGGTILGVDSMNLYEVLKNTKAPLVFFGGGFRREKRNIDSANVKKMKKLFNKAVLKGVRGYLSQQYFVQIGINDTEVVGDPSITFKPVKVERLKGKFKVGVSVRCMGKTGEPQYTDNKTNFKIIAAVCDYLVRSYDVYLYFFDLAENNHDSDLEGIKAVLAKLKTKPKFQITPFKRDTQELFSLLGKTNYIVSQRLHPTILGWAQNTPHLAFEYQFGKTDDFMQSIGMGEFTIRTDEFDLTLYKKKFARLIKEKKIIVSQAKKSIDHWRTIQKNFASRCLDILKP